MSQIAKKLGKTELISNNSYKKNVTQTHYILIYNKDYSEYTKMVHYFLTVVATCEAGNILDDTYYVATKKMYSELVDGE